jgi:transposase
MSKIREILRLKWTLGHSHRNIARSVRVSPGVVGPVATRAKAQGLDWAAVQALTDEALEELLYGPKQSAGQQRPLPDPAHIHLELRRPGVTLELLHLEYLREHPDGYRYTAFCDHYRRWLGGQRRSMRQVHKAGDKMFVDYSGKRPVLADPQTGEVRPVELFVAVLGASSYTYAEATLTQQLPDWIASHVRAFEFFGGITAAVVPDQLRSGVTTTCRYEPGTNRTYAELGSHYGTALIPARPRKPKDKAKVEVGVQVVQRWILARLRNETFFSLAALNARIRELLDDLNARPMRAYGNKSRRELFVALDRPALRPLPAERYVFAEWKRARVNIDYHVEVDHHLYSVPHALVREAVDVRLTAGTVEVFHGGRRVASHVRSHEAGRFTTVGEHMPAAHRKHAEWSPSRLIRWAGRIGPGAEKLVTEILESRPHPEQGYRSCLGILRLGRRYGTERLEAACARALAARARSYRHVESILRHGLDRLPQDTPQDARPTPRIEHENIRGPGYYH